MALTVVSTDARSADLFGRHRVYIGKVTFDASYTTGGLSFTPASVGMAEFDFVEVEPDAAALPGHVVQYNYTTKKLMVFVEEAVAAGGPLLEIANASNLATLVVRVLCIGN